MAYTLLPGIVNRVRVCYISSIFLYFHWDFDNRHYFYDKGTFIAFLKSIPSARLYLVSVIYYTLVELENSVDWQSLIFPFVSSIALFSFRKKWPSYLSYAISPYLDGKLINWSSAFYLSYCCTVLSRILNILIVVNRVISIICVCQLYFMLFHM